MTKSNPCPTAAELSPMGRADFKTVGILVGGTFLVWAILLYPGWLLCKNDALVHSATALALCLVPAAAALVWMSLARQRAPEAVLYATLGGSGLRLFVVAGGGLLLTQTNPQCYSDAFWFWVALFYATTLALELYLVLGIRKPTV